MPEYRIAPGGSFGVHFLDRTKNEFQFILLSFIPLVIGLIKFSCIFAFGSLPKTWKQPNQ